MMWVLAQAAGTGAAGKAHAVIAPVARGAQGLWDWVLQVWRFQIVDVQGAPVTVGSVIIFLVLLVAGGWASKRIAQRVVRVLARRFQIEEGAAAAIQSIVFYLLLVTVALIALHIVNVPITVFAVLGGALAIGIGFGSQNIVNNFISGLILLVERPIRVGNLIQIGDVHGVVRQIGARSTRVVTGDNVEVIVPNSSFLQNNITNWTLSDDLIRAKVTVGVAYGSPVREVEKLLLMAARGHEKILQEPMPRVLFADFGDNALAFELYIWVRIRRLIERLEVESDLRFRIDELCRHAGVSIAFPQRDVHLDSTRPVEVRIVGEGEGSSRSPES